MGTRPEHAQVAAAVQIANHAAHTLAGRWPGPSYACVWDPLLAMAPVDDSYPEDKRVRIYPSHAELACLDLVTDWMLLLRIPCRKILWYRADGNQWRWIARQVGYSPRHCMKLWQQSADLIFSSDCCGILRNSGAFERFPAD